MAKFLLSLIILIYPFLPIAAFDYNLTVCAIFQNDARWLPEWIEFHERQGVEHFYLYNNGSTDNYQQILKPYIDQGLIEVRDWLKGSSNVTDFTIVQCSAYTHCLKSIAEQAKWCAVIDTDEFLFAVNGQPLLEALSEFDTFSGVVVNWVCYGTSGVDRIPDGAKMIETLLLRAPLESKYNLWIKSIVKPKDVLGCDCPHYCMYKAGKKAINENKKLSMGTQTSKKISVNKLRINHYWSRDLDFFYNVKLERWQKWGQPFLKMIEKEAEMNAEYDDIMLKIPH